jgi:hypothetical protein
MDRGNGQAHFQPCPSGNNSVGRWQGFIFSPFVFPQYFKRDICVS